MISQGARQRFRQRLQNIEDADEIIDALDVFVEKFHLVKSSTTSTNWETIDQYSVDSNTTVMVTFSIIGKVANDRAGLKRTAVFYKDSGNVQIIKLEQADFSSKSIEGFNARIIADGSAIKFQVKSVTNNRTEWMGSFEIDKLGE